ncbi:MAG: threonine synthase [Caldiserica bacterium]|nr:threonine synthase [Caldisericota bacterium]MDH7561858.1 threonine synthase [Caldisericota bacterium]
MGGPWRCECRSPLDLEFEGVLDFNKIARRPPGIWRYRESLPIEEDSNIVSLGEGSTPLIPSRVFGKDALLKLDFLFPSGSFKDRGASVLLSKVKELGINEILEDSSGNAGAAIAAYAARAGVKCHIFVPETASPGKLQQIKAYGAKIHVIPGNRSDVSQAAIKEAERIFFASHVWNPYFLQGVKTIAFEIFEQFNFRVPDSVILPVGNGTLLMGAYLGFLELLKQGLIKRIPRFFGVQAEACAPIFQEFKLKNFGGKTLKPLPTLAEGIAVPDPPRIGQVLKIIRETDGTILSVTEEEIMEGVRELNSLGIFAEPTSAVAIAGFKKLPNVPGERVLIPITGSGLKTFQAFQKILPPK